MSHALAIEELRDQVERDRIDTVLVCIVDMQGRLMGKRLHAENFLQGGYKESHFCNYLLSTDLEMATPDGYAATSWEKGYGDYVVKPDISTLRYVPWLEGTAIVLCDEMDCDGLAPLAHAPRQILKKQIARANDMGLTSKMATELEFFLFHGTHDEIAQNNFMDLRPISNYNEDYHIFQTTKEEHVMRPIRNHLRKMGIPVEGSKGEAEAGQEELNIRYADALSCADHHTLSKHAIKEIAHAKGYAATFLAKWHQDRVGSSAHVHQSLWKDGNNAFFDPSGEWGQSKLMDHYMSGLITYASEYTCFLAPYINSYKRFAKESFAPTQVVWSLDNRTAAYRLCGSGSKNIRIECRIPSSDMNPYLAQSAMLAAGLKGIEDKLPRTEPFNGSAYSESRNGYIPRTLRDARDALNGSKMLREAMGDEVIEHYVRAASWEIEEFDRIVTNYEIARGFERS